MAESVYKVIQLVGTSSESWRRRRRPPSRGPPAPCGTSASPRSPNSTWSSRTAPCPRYLVKLNVSFKYEDA